MEKLFKQAAAWMATSRKSIAFTGAGVSTESGIPDFRSAGGLWSRYDPAEYATLGAFRQNPEKVWRMLAELEEVLAVEPNAGHIAMAEFEAEGGLAGIVTQNVDGLHQAGGSGTVVEFHGSGRTFTCLACGAAYSRSEVRPMGVPPRCPATPGVPAKIDQGADRAAPAGGADLPICGAILKPDVVFFDEPIPPQALKETEQLVAGAELVLVVGTSCEVQPASEIPLQVRAQGGRIIEINLDPVPGLEPDICLPGRFSIIMPGLLQQWRNMRA